MDDEIGSGPGNPPEDFTSIQDAVNFSQPGNTVYIYNGTYYEDIEINKTISLIGESKDSVIINGSELSAAIYVHNAEINISNVTVEDSGTGISLFLSNNSLIRNIKAIRNEYGIIVNSCNNSIIEENIASNNNYDGIHLSDSTNITVNNNICFNNDGGIWVQGKSYLNNIFDNDCSFNGNGIYLTGSSYQNYLANNTLSSNINYGVTDFSDGSNIYTNNSIQNSWYGFNVVTFTKDDQIINSSIKNSTLYDIRISGSNTSLTSINTTFNRSKVELGKTTNVLEVKWYLHINVKDYLGNPVPNAKVKIEDNENGSYNETMITDGSGYLKWLTVTEYIDRDTDGDTIGEKTYYTPHRIIAWNDTLVGYAYPEPFMDESKTISIILYNGTLLGLEKDWNLISLPRIQSDTSLETVLQSIEGRYNAVQWYDASDSEDHWKHYHVSKPLYTNDLKELNHTMGFWLYITDPRGTTLVVFGDEPITEQYITIYPGWNLVGYPSKSNKLRDNALDNLNFGSDVDKVERYNTTTGRIEKVTGADYLEVGQAYWIHSKVEEVWNVPL